MELEGKVAFVTGAGSGIGKASAVRFAKEGAQVGVLSDTESEIRATVEEIETAGRSALPLVADMRDPAAVRRAVEQVVERFGRLDIVFANAGINGVWAPIDELEPEEWDRTIETNLRGTYATFRYAVPHLKQAGGGAIVVNASINGTRTFSNAGATAYGCTKAALVALAKMTAVELARHRIRVNAVCPGKIDTEIQDNTWPRHSERAREAVEYPDGQIPLTRGAPGLSQDVAELVLFLVSERARHITGTPVWIDGGQSLLIG
jgi:NAD(P)-dependent dehydrogenase (short-subunit alcohol dehydrogenase family)